MADDNTKPEGPADTGEPCDEGGKVMPDEDPRARNMSGRFPGEANQPKPAAEGEPEPAAEATDAITSDPVVNKPTVTPSDTL